MLNVSIDQKALMKEDQALVPEKYMKGLQSKALMNHLQEDNVRKLYNKRHEIDQKIRQLQFAKKQNERHLYQQQMKKQFKEHVKNQYSKVYDNMINERKRKEREEKERQLWLEKNLLEKPSWIKDQHEQQKIYNQKKQQYAAELQRNLKQQQHQRVTEAKLLKEKQDKLKQIAEEQSRKEDLDSRQIAEVKNRAMQGVRQALDWSHNSQINLPESKSEPLTPRIDRLIKVQQQRFYGKGLSAQYKSQSQRQYFQKNPQESAPRSKSSQKQQPYNPILNPIPHYHRNPNVLNFISKYS